MGHAEPHLQVGQVPGGRLGSIGKSVDATSAEAAQARLLRWRRQRAAQKLLVGEAVASCLRNKRDSFENGFEGVQVIRDKQTGSTHFDGLITCGSVWHCPVCAAKIANQRAAEINAGIAVHKARGGSVAMLTLTYPHDIELPLADSTRMQAEALRRFKQSRSYRRIMEEIGYKGSIRDLEVTFGVNGWHPHTHDLVFATCSDLVLQSSLEQLRSAWSAAVAKSGLGEINQHGFKVDNGDYAAAYIAKYGKEPAADRRQWTAGDELTRSHIKKSRKGATPFQLLDRHLSGDQDAGKLFQEYAQVFKGRRQLYYSPGLKDWLAIEDQSDEEIASSRPEEVEVITSLDADDWSCVLAHNARGEILEIARRHGAPGVSWFLARLRGSPHTDDGGFAEEVVWWRKYY